ncbi:zinc ribbon domain-containing protein [Butyrivibrio sp. MC2013]|uniref:zinc ribbon domain-containing protein n=1 Tax=Butyrivibrio sp. MC2013 TaxID=1280686 RepID=UPI000420794A|nr:zinc ribbon domain-containing protein [Butyrivibrio sp. MC2013]
MSLINCPECGKEVSDTVYYCPHCGYPIKNNKANKKKIPIIKICIIGGIIIVCIIAASIIMILNKLSPEEQSAVNRVEATIAEIGNVTLESEAKITKAEDLYEELSDRCKKHIKTHDTIITARNEYNSLMANETIKLIDEIGKVREDSQKKIDAAQFSYDSLTDEQKKLVTNANVISESYDELSELRVKKVESLISNIGTVTTDSKNKIDRAQKAYNKLSDEDAQKVSNKSTLTAAAEEFASVTVEAAITAINNIGDVKLGSEEKIKNARSAYNSVPSNQKSEVKNYNNLKDAETLFSKLQKEEEDRKKIINPGDTFSTNKWEITYKKTNISAKLLPNSTSGYYLYYHTNDDNETFIDMVFQIKNIDVDILGVDDLVKDCRIEYNGATLSKGCGLYTSSGSDIDKVYTWDGLGALESITLHAAITMPREIQTNNKPITVRCNIAGEEKIIIIRE